MQQAVERRTSLAVAVLTILVVVLLGPAAVQGALPAMGRIAVEVDVEPHPEQPRTFVCTAKIIDLESGEVISAPRVTFLAGSPASVQSAVAAEDEAGNGVEALFQMEVAVTEDLTTARYSSRLLLGEKVVNEQVFRFRLPARPAPEAAAAAVLHGDELPVTLSLRNGEVRAGQARLGRPEL